MTDLFEILESGQPNLIIQVRGEDLLKFSEDIMQRAAENERERIEQQKDKDVLIPKDKVMEMLGICDTTLWQWGKRNYLVPVKAGRKIMYRKTDIDKLFKDKAI